MSSETEGTLDLLRAVTSILGGVRGFALAEAERLAAAASTALEESDEPEEGAALLGSEIRCIVTDQIEPAIRALKGLTGAPANSLPPRTSRAGSGSRSRR